MRGDRTQGIRSVRDNPRIEALLNEVSFDVHRRP